VRETLALQDRYERQMMRQIETLDAEKDATELLDAAAHFNPKIRDLALRKLRSHPNLVGAITTALRSGFPETALAYLEAHGVSEGDKPLLAQPVLDGMLALNRSAEREIEISVHIHSDRFNRRTRLMIAVAEQFADQGLDYVDALRDFRRLHDQGRAAKMPFDARTTLDRWLARQGMFIHGKARSPFDWEQRPYFLRFNTDDLAERKALFEALCKSIGIPAQDFLTDATRSSTPS
jgi:hypothetical protein